MCEKPLENNQQFVDKKCFLHLILIFFIIIVTFISLFPVLQNSFTNWDDDKTIVNNAIIKNITIKNMNIIFNFTNDNYYKDFRLIKSIYNPLVFASYAVEYHFFALYPTPYYATNLLLHILSCLLTYYLIFLLCGDIYVSFITSVLFGIHPLHVESVAWISERKDVLYGFMYLLSIVFYIKYVKCKNFIFFIVSIFSYSLSLFSKPMAITLPLILLLIDNTFFAEKRNLKSQKDKCPYILITVIFIIISFISLLKSGGMITVKQGFQSMQCINRFFFSIFFYQMMAMLPIKQSSIYPDSYLWGILIPRQIYLMLPFLNINIFFLVFLIAKYSRKIGFGYGFFIITIMPVLNIIPSLYGMNADRYTYIPLIGLFYIFSEFVMFCYQNFPVLNKKGKIMTVSIVAIILSILSFQSYERCKVWKNSVTLWSSVISVIPSSSLAYYNRGTEYLELGSYDKAENDFNNAIKFRNDYAEAYNNLGFIYIKRNSHEKAITAFSKSLSIKPDYTKALINRGMAYRDCGDFRKAMADFNSIIENDPKNAQAYNNRGIIYCTLKNYNAAIIDFTMAINVNRKYLDAIKNRAIAYYYLNNYEKSLEDIDRLAQFGDRTLLWIRNNISENISKSHLKNND